MLEHYTSLEQIVVNKETQQIKAELNAYPLYTFMVRLFGFREIGIVALDEKGGEIGKYASENNVSGEITEIKTCFSSPDIIVKAKEKVLVDILHHAEEVKQHPVKAILKYGWEFGLVYGKYESIGSYLAAFFHRAKQAEP